MKTNEGKYWKSEYENLRRKKKKELDMYQFNTAKFITSTMKLFKLLGLSDDDIFNYYQLERRGDVNDRTN